MKKKYLFLFLSVLLINSIYCQEQEVISVVKNQFKINFLLSPGFVYEHGFDAKNTLYSEVSLILGYRHSDFYDESTWYFVPTINEQFRHYYNLQKRANKGKRTAHNSGNYLALSSAYSFKSISVNEKFSEYRPSLTVAPLWGLQRTYKGKFNLDLNLGAGVNFDKDDTEFIPFANFTIGWVIGK